MAFKTRWGNAWRSKGVMMKLWTATGGPLALWIGRPGSMTHGSPTI